MNNKIIISFIAVGMLLSISSFAQSYNEKIDITAPYVPSVNDANKINTNPENINIKIEKTEPTYDFESFKHSIFSKAPSKLALITPLNYDEDTKRHIFSAVVGFGTNIEPLLDININSIQNEKISGGFHIFHNSAWRQMDIIPDNSFNNTIVDGYGCFAIGNQRLAPKLAYNRHTIHYYGTAENLTSEDFINADSIKQNLDIIDAEIALFNAKINDFNYKISMHYSYLQDFYNYKENEINIPVSIDYIPLWINKDILKLDFASTYFMSSINDNNFFISLTPSYMFTTGAFDFKFGVNGIVYSEDINSQKSTKSFIHPIAEIKANIVPQTFNIHIGVKYDSHRNSYKSLFEDNNFLSSPFNITNDKAPNLSVTTQSFTSVVTNTKYNLYAGFDSKIGKIINLSANVEYKIISNLPTYYAYDIPKYQYQNNPYYSKEFLIKYLNIDQLVISGDFTIDTKKSLLLNIHGKYNINIASEATLNELCNIPDYEIYADAKYIFPNKKLSACLEAFAIGRRYEMIDVNNNGTSTTEHSTLDPIYDINLSANYAFNNQYSVWFKLNNILHYNNKAQLWYTYPIYPINCMIGVSISM